MANSDIAVAVDDLPNLLTVAEVADLFRCSPKTIYRRVANGALPAIEDGGRFLFDVRDIRAALIARMKRPKSKSSRNSFYSNEADRSRGTHQIQHDD